MRARVAGPLLVAAAALGCAQPGTPPGGEIDRAPPRVVAVFPEAFDTLQDLDEPVRIRFNERISERLQGGVTEWGQAVLVSPVTSPVEVDRGRRDLEISLVRGWEPDRAYRVVVLPVYQDLFNNQRTEPVELVFSTGGPIPDAALAGFARDRLTGQPVMGARVEATRRIDESVFVAVTDTAGFFALRYMPAGAYDLRGWADQNRDRAVDFFEIQDSTDVVFGVEDTAVVELALLPSDTTPANLARAEALDSATIRLLFDDYFAPVPIEGEATVFSLPDSARVGTGSLLHGSRLDSLQAERAAAAAALAAERARTDSLARAARDTAAAPAEQPTEDPERAGEMPVADEPAEEPEPIGPVEDALPSQELILLVPGLLEPDSTYFVRAEGLTNIQGVEGGGGAAAFRTPAPPPPPDTTMADTVPPDTVPPDTIPPDTIPPDTIPPDTVPPDTVPPDTVPPDTVPPDTVPPEPAG